MIAAGKRTRFVRWLAKAEERLCCDPWCWGSASVDGTVVARENAAVEDANAESRM